MPPRRPPRGVLTQLGALPTSTLIAVGTALVLLLASVGLVVYTLSERRTADRAGIRPTASPTRTVAAVETPVRTPASARSTVARGTSGRATTTPRRGTAVVARGPLGAGQSRAVRGIGGTIASGIRPTETAPALTGIPTPVPPYNPPDYGPPVYNPPSSSYWDPTPTPYIYIPPPITEATPLVTPTSIPAGALPTVALPADDTRAYRYELAYTRSDDLGGIPPSEYFYVITWRSYSADEVMALKDAFGLRGPVEPTDEGFQVSDPGLLIVSNAANGLIRYFAPGVTPTPTPGNGATAPPTPIPTATANATVTRAGTPGATRPTGAEITDDAALAVAKAWLEEKGLEVPENARDGRVTRPVAGQVAVAFYPREPGGPILGDPAIVVTLDAATGAVRELRYLWPSGITQPTLIRLRPVTDAWAEVQAGKGYVEVDAPVAANTPPGTVFKGAAQATQARAGWTLATADDGTSYLLPVYVFEGEVTLEGQSGPVPFRVYIPALQ